MFPLAETDARAHYLLPVCCVCRLFAILRRVARVPALPAVRLVIYAFGYASAVAAGSGQREAT